MKKFIILLFLVVLKMAGYAQQYEIVTVEQLNEQNLFFCMNNDFEGLIIYGENDCDNQTWYITDYGSITIQEENVDSVVIYNQAQNVISLEVNYSGCNISFSNKWVALIKTAINENPLSEQVQWKRKNEFVTLNAEIHCSYQEINYEWSTGETAPSIEVSEPGIYSVTLTDYCGSATYSVEVRDNVEIYRATTDLVTNLNQVTWNTTPEQSEYITAVKVYRNNELVGTVPYTDGVFTDNMGSENTQWQYHIVGVSVEGDDCPIPSYWKRTIHLDRVLGAQGQYILQWTPYEEESPAKDEVTAYGIYDVVNGIPNHVIDVGNFTNVYAYNPADFHGYGAVAAVFAEKGLEEFAFSNLTKELLTSVGENPEPKMSIYPNPTNGEFTVECKGNLAIYNTLGQIVAISHATENGIHSFSLGTGVYFIKSDEGAVQKVVVK